MALQWSSWNGVVFSYYVYRRILGKISVQGLSLQAPDMQCFFLPKKTQIVTIFSTEIILPISVKYLH